MVPFHIATCYPAAMKVDLRFKNVFTLCVVFWAATLSSCQTQEKHRYREGNLRGDETSMSIEEERKLTREVLPQMQKDYPPLQIPEVQSYVSQLGNKVAVASGLEGNPYNYTFTVVDVPSVNAFALPAGTIFITAPLIAMAENEAQLAGVIGHEIGHVKARHTAIRMEIAKREQSKSWKYAAGGGLLGGLLGYGLGRAICPEGDDQCISEAAQKGLSLGASGGMLVQAYGFMANSREDEMEADRIGFRNAIAAGYDKNHVGGFYQKLLQLEQKRRGGKSRFLQSLEDAMSTHPPSGERIQQLDELSQQSNQVGLINTPAFERINSLIKSLPKK